MEIVKLTFKYSEETCYLPLLENLERAKCETFAELKKQWEQARWGGNAGPAEVTLSLMVDSRHYKLTKTQTELFPDYPKTEPIVKEEVGLTNPKEFVICDEFDIVCFKDLAIKAEWYWKPWAEKPKDFYFCCIDAKDSRFEAEDYAFFDCVECDRTICEQNPDNGWMSQCQDASGIEEYEQNDIGKQQICNKCYEEKSLKEGMNKFILSRDTIPALFDIEDEALENGFEVDEDYENYKIGDYKPVRKKIEELDKAGKKVIIHVERMAIGGGEGYITLLVK